MNLDAVKPYGKAFTGAAIAALSTLSVALVPTQAEAVQGLTTSPVTGQELVAIVTAFLTGLAVVWAVPNKDRKGEHQAESVQPPAA